MGGEGRKPGATTSKSCAFVQSLLAELKHPCNRCCRRHSKLTERYGTNTLTEVSSEPLMTRDWWSPNESQNRLVREFNDGVLGIVI